MPYQRTDAEERPPLDGWVNAGAFTLATLAGFVNVTMLSFFAVPVSHMSGAVARLGMDIGNDHSQDLGTIVALVGCFLVGAMVPGVIIGNATLRPAWHYAAILAGETVMLLVAALLTVAGSDHPALFLAAAACGMQNAMASSYRGMIIRTTHVTGIITDIGFLLGCALRTRKTKLWKLFLLLLLAAGYFCGGLASALAQLQLGRHTLFCAAGLSAAITIGAAIRGRAPAGAD